MAGKNQYNVNDINDQDLEWTIVSSTPIVKDEWLDLERVAVRLPDGTISQPFYRYSRRSYVVIVASDEDGRYLCVRQYRLGIRRVTTEFPAGGIETKDGSPEYDSSRCNENILQAAKRELLEETGCVSDDWTFLLTVPSNATIADNYASIFRARNCRRVSEQNLDDTEFLNVCTASAEEIEEMIQNGQFPQSVHVMAWLLAQRKEERRN